MRAVVALWLVLPSILSAQENELMSHVEARRALMTYCQAATSATLIVTGQTGDIRYVETRLPWIVWYETREIIEKHNFCGAPYDYNYLYRGYICNEFSTVEQLRARGPDNRRGPWASGGTVPDKKYRNFACYLSATGTVVETIRSGAKDPIVYPVSDTNVISRIGAVRLTINQQELSNIVCSVTNTGHYPFVVEDPVSGTGFLVTRSPGQIWRLNRKEPVQQRPAPDR